MAQGEDNQHSAQNTVCAEPAPQLHSGENEETDYVIDTAKTDTDDDVFLRYPGEESSAPRGNDTDYIDYAVQPWHISKQRRAAVLICAWLSNFAIYSNMFMFGILYVELLAEFKASKGATAWIGSLAFGVMLFASRLVAVLCDRWGPAVVLALGSLICPASLVFTSLVTGSLYWLYFTYGLCLGIGSSFIYQPVVIYTSRYFPPPQRSRVLSLILTGSLVGLMGLSPSYERVIHLWGWRRALWWLAAVQAVGTVGCALSFSPLDTPAQLKDKRREKRRMSEAAVTARRRSSATHEKTIASIASSRSRSEEVQATPECGQDQCESSQPDVPADDEQLSSEEQSCTHRYSPWRAFLVFVDRVLLNRHFWYNGPFLVYLAACTLWIACYSTPIVHLINMVEKDKNVSSSDAALLLSYSAGSGLVFLPVFGWLSDVLKTGRRRLHLFASFGFFIGLANILVHFGSEYWHFVVYALVIGLCRSGIMLMAVTAQDIVTEQWFSCAWASTCIFSGIPDLIGPPIAGWITDATGDYQLAYIIAGATAMSSIIGFELTAFWLPAAPAEGADALDGASGSEDGRPRKAARSATPLPGLRCAVQPGFGDLVETSL
ncbi:monocarboxylate transporter 8-like [Sycon ciliatum]|uniref:monocarboxylate transporter 8-like n=1 Tax=Sycon ciliatum TaxID=27933 RepID=UPI0031F65CC4